MENINQIEAEFNRILEFLQIPQIHSEDGLRSLKKKVKKGSRMVDEFMTQVVSYRQVQDRFYHGRRILADLDVHSFRNVLDHVYDVHPHHLDDPEALDEIDEIGEMILDHVMEVVQNRVEANRDYERVTQMVSTLEDSLQEAEARLNSFTTVFKTPMNLRKRKSTNKSEPKHGKVLRSMVTENFDISSTSN
uniref:Uncharacterized protein n=1 Tax=Acrobeloides nanus TaxID=290746 RepID=A0A914CWV3_9BILA